MARADGIRHVDRCCGRRRRQPITAKRARGSLYLPQRPCPPAHQWQQRPGRPLDPHRLLPVLCNVSRRHTGQGFSECAAPALRRRGGRHRYVLPTTTKRVCSPRHTSFSSLSVIVQLSVCGAVSDVTLLGKHKQAGKGAQGGAEPREGAHCSPPLLLSYREGHRLHSRCSRQRRRPPYGCRRQAEDCRLHQPQQLTKSSFLLLN